MAVSTVVVNDPVHGHIELDPLCMRIVDTPQFQRLRKLKQLGATNYVFPGATHSRFEHSLGTCYLAGKLIEELRSRQPELDISDVDVLCIKIAGLCHDLGHGPFSHLFDGIFIPAVAPDVSWHHEDASLAMFQYLVKSNCLEEEFTRRGLTNNDILFILEAIGGPLPDFELDVDLSPAPSTENSTIVTNGRQSPPANDSPAAAREDYHYVSRPLAKAFLFEIVANKRNGNDVDKWEYFSRDCHALGIATSFDYSRLMKFLRVVHCNGVPQLCPRDKEISTMYDLYQTRNSLHRRAYQHKTCNIIEHMIVEALIEADPFVTLPGTDGVRVTMSQAIHDMAAYTRLTDDVLTLIATSDNPNLTQAQEILDRIDRRELYKMVDYTHPNEARVRDDRLFNQADADDIAQRVAEIARAHKLVDQMVTADKVVVHIVTIDYTRKKKNPLENVRFWSKSDPTTALKIRTSVANTFMPQQLEVQYVRLYSKFKDSDIVNGLKRAFAVWAGEADCQPPIDSHSILTPSNTPIKARTARVIKRTLPSAKRQSSLVQPVNRASKQAKQTVTRTISDELD